MIYVIKTNHGYLSTHGNRGKKTLLAFKEMKNAINMMHFYCECETKHQDIMMIEKTYASVMIKNCKNSALDMTIMDNNISYCLEPGFDYLKSLQCAYNATDAIKG